MSLSDSCGRCDEKLTDGVHCYTCNLDLHFECGGITEIGYRRMGEDRKQVWRCAKCKLNKPQQSAQSEQSNQPPVLHDAPEANIAEVLAEIRALSAKITTFDSLPNDVKAIRDEIDGLKSSFGKINLVLKNLSERIDKAEDRLSQLEKTEDDNAKAIIVQLDKMENDNHEREQFARANNVELKGVPGTKNENLLDLACAIGKKIDYPISKSQINFVTRVQSRDPGHMKPVIICFNNRYVKEDFVAAARASAKGTPLMAADLGLQGYSKIFVNDHLTLRNKDLLNKTKKVAKEKGFQYVWVKTCKIFARKNDTSPIVLMKTEKDLSKLV